jgi:hypothetical protein
MKKKNKPVYLCVRSHVSTPVAEELNKNSCRVYRCFYGLVFGNTMNTSCHELTQPAQMRYLSCHRAAISLSFRSGGSLASCEYFAGCFLLRSRKWLRWDLANSSMTKAIE